MSGFQPTNPRTHKPRRPCALCGKVATLTKTHIPPNAAFNDDPGRRMMVGPNGQYKLESSPKAGGLAPYGHCEECRAATSPWDDEYILWAKSVVKLLVESPDARRRPVVPLSAPEVRPGRFARAALAGMVVLAENLWRTHPAFVESVRTGAPLASDAGMRFLVGVTPWEERRVIHGCHGRVLASVPLDGSMPAEPRKTLSAMVQWAPFSLILADSDVAPSFPHVDCTSWLELGVDDVAEVSMLLPCMRLIGEHGVTARDYEHALV
jgi:hypothetical protein